MLQLSNWMTGSITRTIARFVAALAVTGTTAIFAPAAAAQQITDTNITTLAAAVDAEIAKAPNHNDSIVWGLFKQLEVLTVEPRKGPEGEALPGGPLHTDANANFYCARIGFFLLKNVAGNPQMFGGWVWPRTLQRITWALNQNSGHPQAWFLWGNIHRDAIAGRNWKEAERGFRFDLVLNPDRIASKHSHVFCLLNLGKPAEALTAADTYLAAHPQSAKLHEFRGDALYSLARYQDAMTAYQTSAHLDLADGGILDKVKNADLKHQTATTGRPMPHNYLKWLVLYYKQHPQQTISEEKRGHLLWSIWDGVRRGQGDAAAQAWGAQCVQCFAALEATFPQSARIARWCDYQAEIYRYDLSQLTKLEDAVIRGLTADPTSQAIMDRLNLPTAGVNLFDHYKGHKQYPQGVAVVNRLLPLLPSDSPLERSRRAVMHQFAFECFKGLGQFTNAEAAIRAAVESDPRNSVYPNSYGLMLRYTGDTAGAETQFRKALEIAPSHPWAAQNLTGLLMAQGQWSAFHDHCSQSLYWAHDTVEQAKADLTATLDPQRVDGAATPAEIAAAHESVDAATHDLLKMRRLWTEGLQLERASTTAPK